MTCLVGVVLLGDPAVPQELIRTADITVRGLKPSDFPRITKLTRLHDAKVPVDEAATNADLGSFASWTRRTENAAGALKRVYMELDGELRDR